MYHGQKDFNPNTSLRDHNNPQTAGSAQVLHRKKRFTSFPSPAGMLLTKLPLGRNNSVMTSLFPPPGRVW